MGGRGEERELVQRERNPEVEVKDERQSHCFGSYG